MSDPKEDGSKQDDSQKRFRVQLDFSFAAYDRLKAIRAKAGVGTNAEVIRNALRLYEWYLEKKEDGAGLALVKDGVIKEVEVDFTSQPAQEKRMAEKMTEEDFLELADAIVPDHLKGQGKVVKHADGMTTLTLPLSDEKIREIADQQVPEHLRGQGRLARTGAGVTCVAYYHPGPGGRQRTTVVGVNADGTIDKVVTN